MKPTLLCGTVVLVALCTSSMALAAPSRDTLFQAGAGEQPANTERDAEPSKIKLPDWLALRLEAELGSSHGHGARLREVSGEAVTMLTADKNYGVSTGISYDPVEKEAELEILAFGSRQVGQLSLEAELGLVRNADYTGWSYTWGLHRAIGERWSVGVQGEGQEPFGHDPDKEHFAGPSLTLEVPRSPVEFQLGYLFGLNSVDDRATLGVEVGF